MININEQVGRAIDKASDFIQHRRLDSILVDFRNGGATIDFESSEMAGLVWRDGLIVAIFSARAPLFFFHSSFLLSDTSSIEVVFYRDPNHKEYYCESRLIEAIINAPTSHKSNKLLSAFDFYYYMV